MSEGTTNDRNILAIAKNGIVYIAVFTFVLDFLLLVQPIYMLQVYDRVLSSTSQETLAFITIMAVAAYVLFGFLEAVRSIVAARVSAKLGAEIGPLALQASMQQSGAAAIGPMKDLATVRGFIAGKAVLAFMSLPFAPVFIAILYFIHPELFLLTLGGALILVGIALANQQVTNRYNAGIMRHAQNASNSAMHYVKGAETIQAMAMRKNVEDVWGRHEAKSLTGTVEIGYVNAVFSGISRFVRMTLQIAILGYGGYLVLRNEMTAGMIFASAIISGRALQPIDQIIGSWPISVEGMKAWERLRKTISGISTDDNNMLLNQPAGHIELDRVTVMPPQGQSEVAILSNIQLRIQAGSAIGIVGPSGAGKSTLIRSVIGAIKPDMGEIRLDGTELSIWNQSQLGSNIGYLPQDVDLFPGTVAENISRFAPDATHEEIIEAANMAKVEPLIRQLPQGFNTMIGPGGLALSGGQRQRIGLARAFFRKPKVLVLDEPNSNLDEEGDFALLQAMRTAKGYQATVLLVSHRSNIINEVDRVLVLINGRIDAFDTQENLLARRKAQIDAARARETQQ